ncbi:MAG: hypothetical protein QMB62_08940, partial [Oscillospiraceae bacterium]
MELISTLNYPAPFTSSGIPARQELWRFGISGCLPLLVRPVSASEEMDSAEALMKQHVFLRSLSCPFDLVFVTDEGGDYLRPAATALLELRRTVGSESEHIHIIDRVQNVEGLIESSVIPRTRIAEASGLSYAMSTYSRSTLQSFPKMEWEDNDSILFYVNHSLPPRTWGNILTNGRFGFFATDCGTGHMWYKNAREYHINRWLCDSVTTRGTEIFETSRKSLFASPDDTDCKVNFGFGFAKWEKNLKEAHIKTTSFVPPDTDARVLFVEWEGGGTLSFRWSTDLVLGGDDSGALRSHVIRDGDFFVASSPESPFPDSKFRICSSAQVTGFTTNRGLWLQEKTDDKSEIGGFIGIGFESSSPFILVCGCDDEEKL